MDLPPQDRTDVERLYAERGRELWARIYAACLDPDLALEALHEAIVRFAQNGHNGSVKDPAAWIVQTAKNWVRDEQRRRRIAARYSQSVPEPAPDPSRDAERAELHRVIREALEELPQEDREVLVLRYYLGWPSRRIAETLEVSPAAVDMRLSRARKRLSERLGERGVSDGLAC